VDSFENVVKEDGVCLPGIRAPEDDDVGIFRLFVRAGSATRSKYCRQTGDTWSVSGAVTAVYIVALHHRANEFLRYEVQLIGRFRAAKHAEGAGCTLVDGSLEASGSYIERLIPRGYS
jgi:hypothetical protein